MLSLTLVGQPAGDRGTGETWELRRSQSGSFAAANVDQKESEGGGGGGGGGSAIREGGRHRRRGKKKEGEGPELRAVI